MSSVAIPPNIVSKAIKTETIENTSSESSDNNTHIKRRQKHSKRHKGSKHRKDKTVKSPYKKRKQIRSDPAIHQHKPDCTNKDGKLRTMQILSSVFGIAQYSDGLSCPHCKETLNWKRTQVFCQECFCLLSCTDRKCKHNIGADATSMYIYISIF